MEVLFGVVTIGAQTAGSLACQLTVTMLGLEGGCTYYDGRALGGDHLRSSVALICVRGAQRSPHPTVDGLRAHASRAGSFGSQHAPHEEAAEIDPEEVLVRPGTNHYDISPRGAFGISHIQVSLNSV